MSKKKTQVKKNKAQNKPEWYINVDDEETPSNFYFGIFNDY
jgi:hypothetical protein